MYGGILARLKPGAQLSLASGVFAGFFPAWRTINRDPGPMLAPTQREGRSAVARMRLDLLAAQVALAVPLLIFVIAFTVEERGRLVWMWATAYLICVAV